MADERPEAFGPLVPNVVSVTWRDAWFDFDEPDPLDVRNDYLVTTVGYLVRNGPRFVSVAQEILPDGDGFRAVTHIPVAVVEKIAPLVSTSNGSVPAAKAPATP